MAVLPQLPGASSMLRHIRVSICDKGPSWATTASTACSAAKGRAAGNGVGPPVVTLKVWTPCGDVAVPGLLRAACGCKLGHGSWRVHGEGHLLSLVVQLGCLSCRSAF